MIPKFSIRQLLWLMVAIGVFSLCMSSAARGNRVAFGISVAVIGSVVPLAVYAIVHWASFAIASFLRLISSRGKTSPQTALVGGVVANATDATVASDVEPEVTPDERGTDD